MNTNDFTKENPLNEAVSSFISSYTGRDTNIVFFQWLAERLRQEMPGMSQEASEKLAGEIIGAVAVHERELRDLDHAVEAGQDKTEWLAERLSEAYSQMPLDTAGERLQRVEEELAGFNLRAMEGVSPRQLQDTESSMSWNPHNVKNIVYGIGDQAILMGEAAIESALRGCEGSADETDSVRGLLQAALKAALQEIKAVVAGAVYSVAENSLIEFLPEDTPMEAICNIAGMAVDSAAALLDAATGDITIMEALERIGRASVCASCCIARYALEDGVRRVPYVGPILVDLLGGLFEYMESAQFHENLYTVIHDAAVATWQWIRESSPIPLLPVNEKVLN